MDDGMQWLAGTILSAVISSVITVGFLPRESTAEH